MNNNLCPNCGGKGWTGDGTDGRHKCPDCTGKLSTPKETVYPHVHASGGGYCYGMCKIKLKSPKEATDKVSLPDKTDDSLVLAKLFTDEKSAIVLANEIEALIQAERIKAYQEGKNHGHAAQHAKDFDEIVEDGVAEYKRGKREALEYLRTYASGGGSWKLIIKEMLAELDTPNKDTQS
jgi:hypothetical protein